MRALFSLSAFTVATIVKFYCSRTAGSQVYFDAVFAFMLGGRIFSIYRGTEPDVTDTGDHFVFSSRSSRIKFTRPGL